MDDLSHLWPAAGACGVIRYLYVAIASLAFVLLLLVAAQGQEAKQSPWLVRHRFQLATAVNASGLVADAAITLAYIGPRSISCPYETGSPQFIGRNPMPHRLATTLAAEFAASEGIGWLLYHYRVKVWKLELWTLPVGYNAETHWQAAIQNWSQCR